MNKEKRIMEEVNKTLQLMDGIKNLEANPFLYTRLKARLEHRELKKASPVKSFALAARQAGFALLFVVNILTAYYFFDSNDTAAYQANTQNTTV